MPSVANTVELLDPKEKFSGEFKWKAGIFLGGVTGISAIIGFSSTLAAAKRIDPEYFQKGISPTMKMQESGSQLAFRALKWGTFYSFAGCGILFYTIWKLSGAENLVEFRLKMGNILPKIPRNDPPVGKTEFSGLIDFLDHYLNSNND